MSEEENTSSFNGIKLEISGKALIHHHHLYLEYINQHHITIGLPQLDNADRQIKLSQYDSAGNVVNEIDMTKYKSIEIVEICEQPTTTQQREDINLEHALSRNQERLSDFYQSYELEDSSIDWSKIATKITLPNTSGIFYDHDDKYTVGFKIEFSPEGVEGIEFKDDETGEAITRLSTSHTMSIGNLCEIILRDTRQVTFCSPNTRYTSSLQYANASDTFYLCKNCSVLYDTSKSTASQTTCFAGGCHSPASSTTTKLPYMFLLPYITRPDNVWPSFTPPNSPNTTYLENAGCAQICTKCTMMVYNNSMSCPASPPNTYHTCSPSSKIGTAYWIYTRNQANQSSLPTIPVLYKSAPSSNTNIWNACKNCGGLYLGSSEYWGVSVQNKCRNSTTHSPNVVPFSLMLKNNIAIYTTVNTSPYYMTQTGGGVYANALSNVKNQWWQLGEPNSSQGNYTLKSALSSSLQDYYLMTWPLKSNSGTPTNADVGQSPQIWSVRHVPNTNYYNIIYYNSASSPYYLKLTSIGSSSNYGLQVSGSPCTSPAQWTITPIR